MWELATNELPYIRQQVKRFKGAGLYDAEDLVSEVCLLSAQWADRYDPSRGTPRQFLYWVVRTAIRNASRKHSRCDYKTVGMEDFDHMGGEDSYRAADTKLCVESLRKHADAIQQAAIETMLNEDDAEAVKAKTGLTLAKRNYHIYKLRGAL